MSPKSANSSLTRIKLPGCAAAVALCVLLLAGPAQAYTDPGSGFLILQAISATVVGAAFYFRKVLARVAGAIFKRPREHD